MMKTQQDPTKQSPATSPAAVPTPAAEANAAPVISVVRRTGVRKVRGKAATVELPVANVLIDGELVAIAGIESGKPVMGVREVLESEIGPILKAVADWRGDKVTAKFVPQAKFKPVR
jgi:hypothetical protein